jgi:hypothetical protein
MKVIAFQAKVSRGIKNFNCDGYFCIRGCFWLEKPDFHKKLQVTNYGELSNREIMYCALYIINYPLTLVALAQTLPTFLSCHKKVGKKVKAAPASK